MSADTNSALKLQALLRASPVARSEEPGSQALLEQHRYLGGGYPEMRKLISNVRTEFDYLGMNRNAYAAPAA